MFVVHFKPDRNHSAADAFGWADCWVVFEESIQPLAPWHPCVAVGDILFSKLLLLWSGFTPTSHQPGIGSAPECAPADRAKGELPRRELALEKVILRVPMNTCEYLSLSSVLVCKHAIQVHLFPPWTCMLIGWTGMVVAGIDGAEAAMGGGMDGGGGGIDGADPGNLSCAADGIAGLFKSFNIDGIR